MIKNISRNILLMVIILFSLISSMKAEYIQGKISGKTEKDIEPLPGASVKWIDTNIGAITNKNGVFKINSNNIKDKRLVSNYIGYKSDTIDVKEQSFINIVLVPLEMKTKETIVFGYRPTAYISNSEPAKTEIITQKELTKAACCDMAGCFETQATVQPQITNVITDSKELRILGLSGVYNQVLFDGIPMMTGLAYTYGISSYPGSLINNIFVSKGANSVLQGFESISGQINVEPMRPDNPDKLFFNAYMNNFLEKQFNLNYSTSLGKESPWGTLLALHFTFPGYKIDNDHDNFLDIPLISRYMIFNRWKYGNDLEEGIFTHIGIRYINEKRVGGQTNYNPDIDEGSSSIYGQVVNYNQSDIYTKTGYRFDENNSLILFASAFYQKQNSYFGTVKYDANQVYTYISIQHELLWNEKHLLKYGVSLRYTDLNENIEFTSNTLLRDYAGIYNTKQLNPGIFAENGFHWDNDKFVWIIGMRLDNDNNFGSFFTPRTLFKYNLNENNTFRASIGTGWRQVNLFSENIGLLSSSRDIQFSEKLNPEKAVNWGLNYVYSFDGEDFKGTISSDFYQTHFQNQFFPDFDTDPSKIIIKNFTGVSISNGFQIESNLKFFNLFELRTSYNFLDVYRIESGNTIVLPFNSKNRAMIALSYRPDNNFYLDLNLHWFDKQRLPNTASNPVEFQEPDYSKPYTLLNIQVTYLLKKFEIYAGCENIKDFRQNQPILNWQNPFSKYFDTSFIWGPTKGREFYIGIRYKISKVDDTEIIKEE